ncbi:ABC transporter permease [Streptomyces sp. FH025]|uniref:ABC transporter permease n=1 Tax=Streptomyces sp. FH025 TaxID=2815937 RepID=UPI001A9E1F60|nr:ABC transporter permease [Streptomyces sp. FH025]MBO1418674.1 ABC transporter permease [Streptomyces sp. FH025]
MRSPFLDQLALGARLAVTSGRDGWGRLLLTAFGVGLGVALLLFTASFPGIVHHRDQRLYTQNDTFKDEDLPTPGEATVLVAAADTTFRSIPVRGRVVQPEGPHAALPPGVAAYPAPGEMVVSPALADLLKDPANQLLRERLPHPVVGTIAPAGLLGPGQAAYVLGGDHLSVDTGALRITEFGHFSPPKPMDPKLILLNAVGLTVMLAPVGVFLAAAARFGGERRDRRLAALRLGGADRRATARIAAGESLVGAVLGLAAGAALFLLARQLIGHICLAGFSFFPEDVAPQPAIAAAIAVVVPLLAVGVTLLAMRRVVLDPLGVVRRSGPARRRIGWRLTLPLAGLALTVFALALPAQGVPGALPRTALLNSVQDTRGSLVVSFGVLLMLIGLCTLLPWLVEAVTRRAGAGPLSWQLAVRRLQSAPGPAAAAVSGVVVAIAGAIALQTLFLGIGARYEDLPRPTPTAGPYQQSVSFPGGAPQAGALADRLAHTTGIAATAAYTEFNLESPTAKPWELPSVRIASCDVLRGFATLPDCRDGDAFALQSPTARPDTAPVRPGTPVHAAGFRGAGEPASFPLPAITATVTAVPGADPGGRMGAGLLLLTPAAVPAEALRGQPATVLVSLADGLTDPKERLTTAVMAIDPQARAEFPLDRNLDPTYLAVKRLLTAGSAITLLLVALSLLVGQLERFREQRRVLGVLGAVGTRRRVLGLSVLWQTLVPMALGLALASVGGLLMGAVLQYSAGVPTSVDWGSMLAMTAIAAGAVLLTTVLGLPQLLRLMRPGALRYE